MRENLRQRLPARAIYELLNEANEVSLAAHTRASALASSHDGERQGRRLIGAAMNIGPGVLSAGGDQTRRHAFFDDVLFGMRTRADAGNADILLLTGISSQLSGEATHYADVCRRHGAEGIVVAAFIPEEPELADLIASGFPTVAIDTRLFGRRAGFISSDNVGGGALAVRHLVELGRKRIAYIGGWDSAPADIDRHLGYESVLSEFDLELRDDYVHRAGWSHVLAREATLQILQLEPRPDAIFCASDVMAIGAITAIQESGLRVPEDIAIVGFDDGDFAAICVPALTSVRQDLVGLGTAAVESVLRILDHPDDSPPSDVLPVELVVRESTGACAATVPESGLRALRLPTSRLSAASLYGFLRETMEARPLSNGESSFRRPQQWQPEKRRVIALAIDTAPDQSFRHAFFEDIFFALRALAYANDIDLLLVTGISTRPGEPMPDLLELCEHYRADGLMVMSLAVEEPAVAKLAHSDFPCVTFDIDLLNDRIAFVMSDNVGGGVKVARHLIETGRRKIAFIGGRGDERPCVDRRFGYQSELKRWGLTPPDEYVAMARWLPDLAYEATEKFLVLPEPPDAVICASDVMALGAIAAIQSAGLRVPEDVAVTGFDDIDYARLASPSLTTVRQSRDALAEGMVKAMLGLLERPGEPPAVSIAPVELIVRESTAIADIAA